MRRLVVAISCFMLASSPAWARLPNSFKDIVKNPKYVKTPTQDQTSAEAIQPTGDYQIFTVGDRFTFLFDPNGKPVVAFDLTLDEVGYKEMFLGAIGIGNWSLRDFWGRYKKVREENSDIDQDKDRKFESEMGKIENESTTPSSPASKDEIERGYQRFAKLKFKDEWINRNGFTAMGAEKHSGFKPASFRTSDLLLSEKQKDALLPLMSHFSQIMYRASIESFEIDEFLKQFRFDWNEDKKEFHLFWDPEAVSINKAKRPEIPAWVVNYQQPLDILAYKYELDSMQGNLAGITALLGQYGEILGCAVTRISNGLRSRLDSHENALTALIDAYQRGEYHFDIPVKNPGYFWDMTQTVLYLNKMVKTDDVTNGEKKRKEILAKEVKAHGDNLKWIKRKGYEAKLWSDGRYATLFKDGKRKGIVNLAMSKNFFTRAPSWHFLDGQDTYKGWSRAALELFVDAFRFVVPQSLNFSQWISSIVNISIDIYIPAYFWDGVFRGRAYSEIAYEGQLIQQFNEADHGRLKEIPGYSAEELRKIQAALSWQRMNPFEVPFQFESQARNRNLKLIKELLGSRESSELSYSGALLQ